MSTRERQNRREFQLFMGRVFAPYAHFRRDKESGGYLSHSVAVAWRIWEAAQYSPYRPEVDGFGKPISKGASRPARTRGRPAMTRKARSKSWQR